MKLVISFHFNITNKHFNITCLRRETTFHITIIDVAYLSRKNNAFPRENNA